MTPRSAGDKEFFAQDWFADRLTALSLPFVQQGRNSYPDFVVGTPEAAEGFELKSLAFVNNRPARSDIDFNITIPSGYKNGRHVFLVFILYTGAGSNPRPTHTISVAHADLINSDHELADEHLNVAIRNFGSFADGFVRNRKMYVFPHPIALDPTSLGKQRLIVPQEWNLTDARLTKIKTLEREIAPKTVDSYTIQLRGRLPATVNEKPALYGGTKLYFDVFEAA